MSSHLKKAYIQNANLIISWLISVIAFVFITLFARGLSGIDSIASLENLFYYCKDSQTLTLFGEVFPLSDFTLKLLCFPRASIEFTLKFFPALLRDFIYTAADTFCKASGDFISFIIEFITK